VATVWAKDKSGWSLVSCEVEPELKPAAFPSPPQVSAASSEPALPVIDGDPELKRSVGDFLDAWYLRKDAVAAFA